MSVTFEILRKSDATLLSKTIGRTFDWGDRHQTQRRQEAAVTEAGVVFVQDLGRTDQFVEGTFNSITLSEKADLLEFFGTDGANYREREFKMAVTNGIGISPNGDGSWSGRVRLEQAAFDWRARRGCRFQVSMRFRVVGLDPVVVADAISVVDFAVGVVGPFLADAVEVTDDLEVGRVIPRSRSDAVAVAEGPIQVEVL